MPAMQLKMVLLPEPFGPIRPRISPSLTSNDTFATAVKPPNILVRPETLRNATWPARVLERLEGATRHDGSPIFAARSARVGVPLRQRQHRIDGTDRRRPRDLGVSVDVLHHDRCRALVLSRHLGTRRK